MNLLFAARLARRELRSTWRRTGVYTGAITLGVAALVAINSYRVGVVDAVLNESRALLGADVRVSSGRVFPDSVVAVVDSAARARVPVARVTGTISMALAASGRTRLLQIRGVEPGYPFYGAIETDPIGLWPLDGAASDALVERALLVALDVEVGDSLRIGERAFRIAGVLTRPPIEIGFRSAIAPRVFIPAPQLAGAGLLGFGSLADHEVYLRLPDDVERQQFVDRNHGLFARQQVRMVTAQDEGEELAEGLAAVTRFLGLVGLTALLLGGLGVGSAVHVFVRDKRTTIAVLRCLGATQGTAFAAYLGQAALLGLAGAALGAVLGIAIQAVLPFVLGSTIPVEVPFRVFWSHVAAGLGIGVWVSIVFALLPLLEVRGIPPLQALRYAVEEAPRRFDIGRLAAFGALLASVLALALLQAPEPGVGFAFAGGLAGVLLLLRTAAWMLMRAVRRLFPRRASYPIRQGVASLFRPDNQTAAVTVALGFGVFLIAAILSIQRSLLVVFRVDDVAAGPDVIAFDIQADQRAGVIAAFTAAGLEAPGMTPIVPARIARVNGETVEQILSGARASEVEPWAYRREYRHTYRAQLSAAESLVAGEWWDDSSVGPPAGRLPRISVEAEIASSLGISVGDTITWDLQGARIETRVASIRSVDWARFDTNFFVVFEPGVLEAAPQTFIAIARVGDAERIAALQRDIVRSHPNVSMLDLTLVQDVMQRIVNRVTLAIRFMGLFCVAGGILVLAGALSASRFQRLRETVLLRTLGATRRQIRQVLFTEYAALGSLAGIAGTGLGAVAAWLLVRFFFELRFDLDVLPLLWLLAGTAVLAIGIGVTGSRSVVRRPPLAVLREAGEEVHRVIATA
ncbi:MAG: FtsX-like permease family protein [Gemmatimonadetes bacterium]|nr:FtsX-like permease family protein [Gemmatimonadota bacterium]